MTTIEHDGDVVYVSKFSTRVATAMSKTVASSSFLAKYGTKDSYLKPMFGTWGKGGPVLFQLEQLLDRFKVYYNLGDHNKILVIPDPFDYSYHLHTDVYEPRGNCCQIYNPQVEFGFKLEDGFKAKKIDITQLGLPNFRSLRSNIIEVLSYFEMKVPLTNHIKSIEISSLEMWRDKWSIVLIDRLYLMFLAWYINTVLGEKEILLSLRIPTTDKFDIYFGANIGFTKDIPLCEAQLNEGGHYRLKISKYIQSKCLSKSIGMENPDSENFNHAKGIDHNNLIEDFSDEEVAAEMETTSQKSPSISSPGL